MIKLGNNKNLGCQDVNPIMTAYYNKKGFEFNGFNIDTYMRFFTDNGVKALKKTNFKEVNNNEKIKSKFCKFKHFNALSSGQADIFLLYSLEKVNKKCHNRFYLDPKELSLLVTSEKAFKHLKKNNSDLLKFIFNNVFSIGKKHFNKATFQKENNILKLITRERKKDFSNYLTLSIDDQKDLNKGKEFIVNYLGTHKDDTIVMEYLSKGGNYIELFNAITIVNYFKSDIHGLLRVFENILLAVKFLHHVGICHGDIKAENIFISTNKEVKIIDFGGSEFCKIREKKKRVRFQYGTNLSTAPEIYKFTFVDGVKADLWSLGVLLYSMHSSCSPYTVQDPSKDFCFKKITENDMLFTKNFSNLIKPIVKGLMTYDPSQRFDMDTALKMTRSAMKNCSPINY